MPSNNHYALVKSEPAIKRIFDVFLAIIGLVLSSPLWVIFTLLIYIEDRGPIFFTQRRCGIRGKSIYVIKFRSMVYKKNMENELLDIAHDPRVTRIGRILRTTSMDELPTLITILKGDMSFVGPKPLPFEIGSNEKLKYTDITKVPGYYNRSQVKPGLTGIAQVYASKSTNRRAKFHYDYLYIKNWSFILDIKLILLSFIIAFKGRWESRVKKL